MLLQNRAGKFNAIENFGEILKLLIIFNSTNKTLQYFTNDDAGKRIKFFINFEILTPLDHLSTNLIN